MWLNRVTKIIIIIIYTNNWKKDYWNVFWFHRTMLISGNISILNEMNLNILKYSNLNVFLEIQFVCVASILYKSISYNF